MGFIRELFATGELFADMQYLFGAATRSWKLTIWENYPGFLSLSLAPGALLVFALLLAAKNALQSRKATTNGDKVDTESRRIRVTGRIA